MGLKKTVSSKSKTNRPTLQLPRRGDVDVSNIDESLETHIPDAQLLEKFPSLDLAYQLATAAYETSQKRLDAVDAKQQSLTGLTLTAVIAIPTIGKALEIVFTGPYFTAFALFAVASLVASVISVKFGKVERPDPAILWDTWIEFSKERFMYDAIYHAGKSVKSANRTISQKWWIHWFALACFFIAIACGVYWLSTAPSSSTSSLPPSLPVQPS